MTTATLNVNEVTEFWRVARRLYAIYAELDQTYELGQPPCAELQDGFDHDQPEVLDRIRQWFDAMDSHIQVWQLRQLLQSTGLQNEENLRYLIVRHLERKEKSESDKEKIDFLLVQYFAHCAPGGITENQVTLDEVARVLQPALGLMPDSYPDWANALDEKLQRLNQCNSLEDLQNSGALLEVRELKLAVGDQYFEPGLLVAFTRFNFRARRAFFKAMHMDLHAIRSAVNELEQLGHTTLDCREAGLTESESLEQVRHVVHQWKTPFRAPYSGGSSFLQLILLRHSLQHALSEARAEGPRAGSEAVAEIVDHDPKEFLEPVSTVAVRREPELMSVQDVPAQTSSANAGERVAISDAPPAAKSHGFSSPGNASELSEEEQYLQRCVADIADQLIHVPAKNTPSVSAIVLGGCKLLIATWEAEAFTNPNNDLALGLQRTVAARTILHVCMERQKKNEPTDMDMALKIARAQAAEMEARVSEAKESRNIDAAVNLAATTKRLMALIEEGEKLLA